jgi:hypothetical protein
MKRSSSRIFFVLAGVILVVTVCCCIKEGAFKYMTAEWERVAFVAIVTALGTVALLVWHTQAPHMGRVIHHPLLLLGFGIVMGGMIGILDITIVSSLWALHGEPEGYFRHGWSGVTLGAIVEGIGGAFAGVGFGGVLCFVESRFQRAIQFGRLAILMLLIAVAVFGFGYFGLFHWGWQDTVPVAQSLVFVGGSLAAAFLSAKAQGGRPPVLRPEEKGVRDE